ncbi:MAG: histidine phosphatase family protein [Candidatus Lambdaproteobacteria bacterium]|nr:histidine phosphatase family protein [Candidatus Lambdaproteobacteria bacterium]
MTRLTLVRHGETYQNFNRMVQGQDPTQGRLTPRGVRQAELLGQALAEWPFDIAYCSSLERAVLTLSMVLLKRFGERTLPLVFADALREINLGVLHGRSHGEWREAISGDPMHFRAAGGESWLDVQARVTGYLHQIILSAGHQHILVVAHGGVNRGLIASLLGFPMAQAWEGPGLGAPQDNTCLNVLELNDGGEVVSALVNDTRHLAEEFPGAGGGQRWLPAARRWELLPGGRGLSSNYNPVG